MARKKSDPSSVQSRNFKLLLYPDNELHVAALAAVKDNFPEYIGILHDQNPEAKPHYHVAFKLEKPQMLGTVARKLGLITDLGEPDLQFVRPCDGRFDRFLVYLTHLDQPDKEQYDASALFGSSALISDYGRAATKFLRSEFDMADCVLACLDWIRGHEGIVTMTGFARWICGTPYFKASASPIVRACIEEHNQRIYNSYRSEYIKDVANGVDKFNALMQYPEADPEPPKLPELPDNFDLDGFEVIY